MLILTPWFYFVIWLLGTVATAVAAAGRRRYARPIALGTTLLTALLWLLGRSRITVFNTAQNGGVLAPEALWFWHVDDAGWLLGLVLLLVTATAVSLAPAPDAQNRWRVPPVALMMALSGAGLFVLLAGTLATFLLSWTLLSLLWSLLLLTAAPAVSLRAAAWRLGALWAPLLFLWLAAVATPTTGGFASGTVARWPTLAKSFALVAAVLQLGVFPFHYWRPLAWELPPAVAALLHTMPAAAGCLLLARLEATSDIGLGFALPLTLFALLGMLAAGYLAWSRADRPMTISAALVLGQAGIVLLAGVWATTDAVLAEARVLLLAGAVLLVAGKGFTTGADDGDTTSGPRLLLVPPLLAAAALAAFPLTAGFTGRAALYGAWLAQGRWLLLVVTVLLHISFVAAAIYLVMDTAALGLRSRPAEKRPPLTWAQLLTAVLLLIPTLGLFSLRGLAEAPILVWVAILFPVAAGVALLGFAGEARDLQQAFAEAFAVRFPLTTALSLARRALAALVYALREAAAMLEGEGGLIWLLLFVVILWLAR